MHAKTTGKPAALAIVGFCGPAAADGIVATIKPLHSLVSFVTAGVADPHLLIGGAASLRGFALRPSDARALENARVIFRIDENFEATLSGPDAWPQGPGGIAIPCTRRGPEISPPRQRFRGPRPQSAYRNGREPRRQPTSRHGARPAYLARSGKRSGDGGRDRRAMSVVDPANAFVYAENGRALALRLEVLTAEIGATLSPVRRKPFIVFHDAYHYFEDRFDLTSVGSITIAPERLPGAQRIAEIRARLRETAAVCVFREPQFSSSLVDVVVQGTTTRTAILDPLGATIEDGPELYFSLIRAMAASLRKRLG